MDAPTAADLLEWTKVEDLQNADPADVDRYVARANAAFVKITGLQFASVPAEDEPLVEQAVQGLAESIFYETDEDRIDTLKDFDLIQSLSAGPYSETRRSAEDAMKARMLHAWPWLSSLLWSLLTPDKYDYWISFFGGDPPPASAIQEVDWSGGIGFRGSDLPTGGRLDPWEQ
jgi:hypothetical protein